MLICGIDPGITGGIAFYKESELVVFRTPVFEVEFVKSGKKKTRKEMDLNTAWEYLEQHKPDVVVLEKVTARQGEGVTSSFRFGQNFGQWQGLATALKVEVIYVRPQQWKAYYDLSSDKNESSELARQYWPEHEKIFKVKKNNGMAESALIAKWYGNNQKHIDISET